MNINLFLTGFIFVVSGLIIGLIMILGSDSKAFGLVILILGTGIGFLLMALDEIMDRLDKIIKLREKGLPNPENIQ